MILDFHQLCHPQLTFPLCPQGKTSSGLSPQGAVAMNQDGNLGNLEAHLPMILVV